MAACGLSGGAAHSDLVLWVSNRSASTVVFHWSGSSSGWFRAGGCHGDGQGLDAGDYTITLDNRPDASFVVHVDHADPSVERMIVVRPDGSIDNDADPGRSLEPCASAY